MWTSLPIAIRLPLLGAAMMVLVGFIASQQMLAALARVEQDRLRDLARMHVDALSLALGPHALRRDVWEIFDLVDRAERQTPRIDLIVVADPQGRVLAASDPRRAPVDAPVAPMLRDAAALDALTLTGSERLLRLVSPLIYQGRPVGQILTQVDIADIRAARRRLIAALAMGNMAATGLVAVLGYALLRRALRPIGTLTRYMAAGGERPEPIPPALMPLAGGEMTRLASSYNALAAAVAQGAQAERHLAERERLSALGRLASTLAHEINNPLGGLLNATDTIRSYPDRPDVVRASADLLYRGLVHLRDVTRAALDQNRISRDGGRPFRSADLDDLRLLVSGETRRRGQRVDWPASIADTAMPASLLRQVLLNLLLNASAAAGAGGRIGLEWRPGPDASLRITVTDSGPGLDPSAAARLCGDAGADPSGHGVGLRLVRQLVLELGGTIALERADGITHIILTFRGS